MVETGVTVKKQNYLSKKARQSALQEKINTLSDFKSRDEISKYKLI